MSTVFTAMRDGKGVERQINPTSMGNSTSTSSRLEGSATASTTSGCRAKNKAPKAAARGTTDGEDPHKGGQAAAATFAVASPSPATAVLFYAAFGALFFALHPRAVEAVAEPANREAVLVLLPMLVGLICLST
ncbi:MAG: hypothetical protein ACKOFH_08445, partial [Chthoniobacterales bacterium]